MRPLWLLRSSVRSSLSLPHSFLVLLRGSPLLRRRRLRRRRRNRSVRSSSSPPLIFLVLLRGSLLLRRRRLRRRRRNATWLRGHRAWPPVRRNWRRLRGLLLLRRRWWLLRRNWRRRRARLLLRRRLWLLQVPMLHQGNDSCNGSAVRCRARSFFCCERQRVPPAFADAAPASRPCEAPKGVHALALRVNQVPRTIGVKRDHPHRNTRRLPLHSRCQRLRLRCLRRTRMSTQLRRLWLRMRRLWLRLVRLCLPLRRTRCLFVRVRSLLLRLRRMRRL